MRLCRLLARILTVTALLASGLTIAVADAQAAVPPVAKRGVRIAEIYFDSAGPDNGSNRSLNREWVKVVNTTNLRRNITGWTLHDSSSHRYVFVRTILAPHSYVYVHSGRGHRNLHNRYWGSTTYIWNNSGDAARLANANAVVVSRCSYSARFDSVRKWC